MRRCALATARRRRVSCARTTRASRSSRVSARSTSTTPARYIHQQAPAGAANPTGIGTGGTPFMSYLLKHREETERQRIGAGPAA